METCNVCRVLFVKCDGYHAICAKETIYCNTIGKGI
jgi:hypothetical protein